MDGSEVINEIVKGIISQPIPRGYSIGKLKAVRFVAQRHSVALEVALSEIFTINANGEESVTHCLDLSHEIGGREPPFAQRVRWGVRRRYKLRSVRREVTNQPGHHHGVPRIIQLELVDTDEPSAFECVYGTR